MSAPTLKKSLHKHASFNSHILHVLNILLMIGFSTYLTYYYFESWFPKGLGSASLCDISSFFSCGVTTRSPLSNVFGVPISVFGLLLGFFLLGGYFIKSIQVERTTYFILIINAICCTGLFLYSVFVLQGLCPFCIAYYASSCLALVMYWKYSTLSMPCLKILVVYGVAALTFFGVSYAFVQEEERRMSEGGDRLIRLYDDLAEVGKPQIEHRYYMNNKAKDAPVEIIKFSDFQCPACKSLSESLHKVLHTYGDEVSIQYMFYPLDNNCNPKITRSMHTLACEASYLASCFPDNFAKVERDIFHKQGSLSKEWLSDYAKKEGVWDCYKSQESRDKVESMLAAAESFDIQATPTMLINGRKIDRLMPVRKLYMLIDKLLERANR